MPPTAADYEKHGSGIAGARTPSAPSSSSSFNSHRTLDLEHVSIMKRIEKEQAKAILLKEESDRLASRIQELEARPMSEMMDVDFDELKRCMRELDAVNAEIEEAEAEGDSVDYFVRTAAVLFNYYDVLEKGGPTVSQRKTKTKTKAASKNTNTNSTFTEPRSILSYFTQQPAPSPPPPRLPTCAEEDDDSEEDGEDTLNCDSEDEEDEPSGPVMMDRASLYEKYMHCVNGAFAHHQSLKLWAGGAGGSQHGPCTHCGCNDRTVQLQEGSVFCNKCRTQEYILVDHEKPSYKDPPKDVSYFAYKRSNHFSEWLNQVQGKETTEIPEEVYDAILLEIKKEKVTNMATLTKPKIKTILKRLKIHKFYEHATLIISRINGIPPPHFPPELEDKLRQMFCQIQVPFLKHAPPKRKNFLSYSYCLRKMVQLLEQDQYIESFSLLKARDKLQVQDNIWKNICQELSWEYIPSL